MTETQNQSTPQSTPQATAPVHNPWLVLLVLCSAVFMLLLDTTIVNVAQRKIQDGLDADLTGIQWVLDSYILAYAVLLLSFGRMGDVYGRKRLFIVGIAIFTLASALCGASVWIGDVTGIPAINVLIAARVLQGIGGSFMMPQSLSLLTVAFPPEKRGAAMGLWGAVVALGAVCGPIIGGLIVTNFAWEWVFLINLPVGIAAILATQRIVPESVDPNAKPGFDWGGVALSGLGIFALVYASIEGNKEGWTSPIILSLFAASAVLLATFVWWERRVVDPMMKLELFFDRNFSIGVTLALIVSFGMLGIFFPMTLFLQGIRQMTPIEAGLTMTPMSLMIMVSAPIAGRLTDRFGARWLMVAGLALMTSGILLINSQIDTGTDWVDLLPALIVTGTGMGFTFAPMTTVTMASVPYHIAGSASGVLNTMRNVGQVLGIAILGSVLSTRLGSEADTQLRETALSEPVRAQAVALVKQSRFEQVVDVIPGDQAALLPEIFHRVNLAFADSLQQTFLVSALACGFAVLLAIFVRNPARRAAPRASMATQQAPQAQTAD